MNKSTPKVTTPEIKKALALKHAITGDYFLTEVKSGSSWNGTANRILDGLAIKKSYASKCFVGYEIKISRSDFKSDNKIFTYLPLVHQLYLVCPKGLVQPEELPTEIGLLWYNSETKSLYYKKKTPKRDIKINTDMLLYIIYSRLEQDRIPFYSSRAEYFKDWLDNKLTNQELGNRVSSALVDKISSLEKKLDYINRWGGGKEQTYYKELLQACADMGMPDYYKESAAEWIKREFKREYPEILDTVQRQLEVAMNSIEREKMTAYEANEKQME